MSVAPSGSVLDFHHRTQFLKSFIQNIKQMNPFVSMCPQVIHLIQTLARSEGFLSWTLTIITRKG
jgi:hypothetical protein